MTNAHLPEPTLEMREGTPVSAAFGDVYFSREGAVAETRHVFLAGNQLPKRWENADLQGFSVAELGFGTGVNFLTTLQAFRRHAPAGATLDYHAVEQFPFRPAVLRGLFAQVPELAAEAEELLACYPLRLPGPHRIVFARAVLTLWLGDVRDWLAGLPEASINAWYLDGFAPAKNPDMWGEGVFAQMARASAPEASFATFTAASAVRRGLEAAGFTVEKVPGFGKKREMLRGGKPAHAPIPLRGNARPDVVIIGAGIAGASLAQSFATRGHRVTVLERATVAGGASGNDAGVLFPPLAKQWTPTTAFYFAAYGYMRSALVRWAEAGLTIPHESPGMLRLPRDAEEAASLQQVNDALGLDADMVQWVDAAKASEIAGVALHSGAAYFPQGTWLSPRLCCTALLQHKAIALRENCAVTSLTRAGDEWRIMLASGEEIIAPIVCVAAAYGAAELLPDYGLRLQQVGGQVSAFAASDVAAPLRSILCRKGYVIPQGDRYLIGATYHREDLLAVSQARHAENLAELTSMLPGWFMGTARGGRSAIRTTTPSRVPYIGTLEPGLYVSLGHGSRGLLSAPLAAEIITDMATNAALPISSEIAQFLAANLARGLHRH